MRVHARRTSGTPVPYGVPPTALEIAEDAASRFSTMVADRFVGEILPYPQRQVLLRAAARLGIDRFQANLIIAAVQHRQPRAADPPTRDARGGGRWVLVTTFLLIEAAISFAAWRAISG